jgi:hypothetical protein
MSINNGLSKTNKINNSSTPKDEFNYLIHKYYYLFPIIILLTSLFAYTPGVQIPTLFGDDWGFFVHQYGQLDCPKSLDTPRPLDHCATYLLSRLIGLNIGANHIILLVLNLVVPLLFFYLLENIFQEKSLINFLITFVFIVFPTDINHHWLNIINYRVVSILMLGGGILFLKYWRTARWQYLGLSTLLFLISIGIYEIHLGLLIAGSLLVFLFPKNRNKYYRIGLLIPMLISGAAIIWRVLIPASDYGGWSLQAIDLTPSIIITKIAYLIKVNAYYGWSFVFEGLTGAKSGFWLEIFLIMALVLLTFIFSLLFKSRGRSGEKELTRTFPSLNGWLKYLLLGLVLIVAGYFPIIVFNRLNLDFDNARIHIMASFGGAITLIALLGILVRAFRNQSAKGYAIISILVLIFFMTGVTHQWKFNYFETKTAWEQQKSIWKAIFQAVPDISPNTTLVLLLPEEMDAAKIPSFLSGPYGFSSGLSALYGKSGIQGYFQYNQVQPEQITESGLQSIFANYPPIPYPSIVLFQYDPADHKLIMIDELIMETPAGKIPVPLCNACLINRPNDLQLSYLVR